MAHALVSRQRVDPYLERSESSLPARGCRATNERETLRYARGQAYKPKARTSPITRMSRRSAVTPMMSESRGMVVILRRRAGSSSEASFLQHQNEEG
jgi:hypothetical protein